MVPPTEANQDTNRSLLQSECYLSIHTENARRLMQGTWQIGKMGLYQFVHVIAVLQRHAKLDDPYADWFLLATYEQMKFQHQEFEQLQKQVESKIHSLRDFEISIYTNPTPVRYSIPYSRLGRLATQLLQQLDYITRLLLTLRSFDLPAPGKIQIFHLKDIMQKIYAIPRRWHKTGVTRVDFEKQTILAKKADALMGNIFTENTKQK